MLFLDIDAKQEEQVHVHVGHHARRALSRASMYASVHATNAGSHDLEDDLPADWDEEHALYRTRLFKQSHCHPSLYRTEHLATWLAVHSTHPETRQTIPVQTREYVQSKAELLANVTRWLAGNTACLAVVRIQAQTVINHLSAALAGTPLLDVPEVVECLCSEGKDHSHAFGDLPPELTESGVPTQWMGCKDHLHPVSPPPRNHPSVRARHEHRWSVLRAQERVLVAKGLAYSLQNNPMQRAVTPAFTDRIARHAWHSMVTGHSSPVTREQQLRARIFVDVATLVRVGIVHADGEALAARVASEGRSHGHCVAGLRLSSQTVEDSIATALTSEFWTGTGADGRAQGRTGRVRFWVVGGLGVLYDAQWVQLQHAEHTGRPATPSVLVPSVWDLVRRTFFKYHTHVIIDGNKLSPV
jgi:hypothetical protein